MRGGECHAWWMTFFYYLNDIWHSDSVQADPTIKATLYGNDCIVLNLLMNEIRLLIIEEHEAVRDALQVRLASSANLAVVAAYQSTTEWRSHMPDQGNLADVVLLGLKSGRKRPLTAIIHDVKEFNRQGLSVIVLASLADDVEKELILQAGAQRYLLKNINSNQLIAEIQALAPSKVH